MNDTATIEHPPISSPSEHASANAAQFEELYVELIRTTRTCIQYGTCGFAVLCIVIGAVESMFGR